MEIFDLIGIGFGPANLALAVALKEEAEKIDSPKVKTLFLESKSQFVWHPGMLLEDMSIQVSFLKDLATLRNPRSQFTFLNYLKECNRLDDFINLQEFFPTRLEINNYFEWAAKHFENQVIYGKRIIELQPLSLNGEKIDAIEVIALDTSSGNIHRYIARNLVIATGGKPQTPQGVSLLQGGAIFHSSEFLDRIKKQYNNSDFPYHFAIVGSGQSGAEIFYYLANHYPNSKVTATIRSFGYKPMDDSGFINEIFFPQGVDLFYNFSDQDRSQFLKDYKNINYSVVDASLIKEIYDLMYKQKLICSDRLRILPFLNLDSSQEESGKVNANFTHIMHKHKVAIQCDALILATGYQHHKKPPFLDGISKYLKENPSGDYHINRHYHLTTSDDFLPQIFLQGLCEETHGFSDTLLSLLPIRASEIINAFLTSQISSQILESESNRKNFTENLTEKVS